MLIEILSLLFYFYYWMTWLQGKDLTPELEAIRDLLGQNGDNT